MKKFREPSIHSENLNNLDVVSDKSLTRIEIDNYFNLIEFIIKDYISKLTDEELLEYPDYCEVQTSAHTWE